MQLRATTAELEGLRLIENSYREGDRLNGQLLLFLQEIWDRLVALPVYPRMTAQKLLAHIRFGNRLHRRKGHMMDGIVSAESRPTELLSLKTSINAELEGQ